MTWTPGDAPMFDPEHPFTAKLEVSREDLARMKEPLFVSHVAPDITQIAGWSATGGDRGWRLTEWYVWPGAEHWLAMKSASQVVRLPGGDPIHLYHWTFVRITPEQLRKLADAMDHRQCTTRPVP